MRGDLPAFRLSPTNLPAEEAYEAWRKIMSRMFDISKPRVVDCLPQGGVSTFLLGDMMANRSGFNAQRLTRDRRVIEATPDHLVLQLYLSGGFSGDIGGKPVRISRGNVAVCDLRKLLDVEAVTSSTIGLSIPRSLLDGINLEQVPARLDRTRERLLAARMTAFHQRLPTLALSDLPGVTAELVGAIRRLLDPSTAHDVLDARELDADRVALAEQVIAYLIALPDLSPATIAERLQMSRATLYRLFAERGGVMHHVWKMRLEAVRAALDQPMEPRTLARLAADHGFKSTAHLSRSFRAHYGVSPREWRVQHSARSEDDWKSGAARLNAWWHTLGR